MMNSMLTSRVRGVLEMSLLYLFFSNHFSAITSQGTHVVKKKEKEEAEADGADVGAVRFETWADSSRA